jgi:sugar phosphate permease
MALIWAWLSDGPFKGRRWPFIYAGAVIAVSLQRLLRKLLVLTTTAVRSKYNPIGDAIVFQHQRPHGIILA